MTADPTIADLARETGATVLRISRHVARITAVQGTANTVAWTGGRGYDDRVLTTSAATAVRNAYRDGDDS